MSTRNIVPRANAEGGIGTSLKQWGLGWINTLVVTTLNALTLTAQTVGFTLSGGTSSKTLTVTGDATIASTPPILGANTFTGTQIYSDQQNTRAMFADCGLTFLDKGDSGTTTQTFDYTAGSHQRVRATGNFTIALSNFPPSGNLGELLIELVADGTGRTITWPTVNWVKSDGSFTTTFSSNGVTLQTTASAIDWVLLWSRDGGTTVYGKIMR